LRIDAPQITLVAFPGTVPHLAIDPVHGGNETVVVCPPCFIQQWEESLFSLVLRLAQDDVVADWLL
jgi:hypothetical protein